MDLLVLRGGFLFEKGPVDIYALCLICPLFRVFCSERCYFSFVSAVSLQRRAVRINYRLPLAFIVAQYLLLARYRAWARELSGPIPSLCVLVHLCVCGANGRIWEWGFGDWRIGGPVTVERGGYMRFYESTGEGFVLFSCEARPLELPKATEIRSEAARPFRIYPHSRESRRFPMPNTISECRWHSTHNAYIIVRGKTTNSRYRIDLDIILVNINRNYWFFYSDLNLVNKDI